MVERVLIRWILAYQWSLISGVVGVGAAAVPIDKARFGRSSVVSAEWCAREDIWLIASEAIRIAFY